MYRSGVFSFDAFQALIDTNDEHVTRQYIIEWVGGTVSERPRNILELKPANFSLNCFSRFEGSYIQKLYW